MMSYEEEEKMKRILAVLAVVMLTAIFLVLPVFADGDGIVEADSSEYIEIEENVEEDVLSENTTFAGRILEYVRVRKTAALTAVGDIVIVAFAAVIKRIVDKRMAKMEKDVQVILGDASTASKSGLAVINTANGLIDGYNEMKASYDEYKVADGKRDELVRSVMEQNARILIQNATVLEILRTVYGNSKNLPQGVKDIITLEIANCRKLTEGDDALALIVKTISGGVDAVMNAEAGHEK